MRVGGRENLIFRARFLDEIRKKCSQIVIQCNTGALERKQNKKLKKAQKR
jgi:hypothetical protein